MNWLQKIWKWISDAFAPTPAPDPGPAPQPAPNGDALDIATVKWLGSNYGTAKQAMTLGSASISAGGKQIAFSDSAPKDWPTTTVKVKVQGIACFFYERGKSVVGGKFDWTKPGQTIKGLENVHNGYNGHSMPATGTPAYAMLVDVNGKQRSNLVKVAWK